MTQLKGTDILDNSKMDELFPPRLREELADKLPAVLIDAVKVHIGAAYLNGVTFGVRHCSNAKEKGAPEPCLPKERSPK